MQLAAITGIGEAKAESLMQPLSWVALCQLASPEAPRCGARRCVSTFAARTATAVAGAVASLSTRWTESRDGRRGVSQGTLTAAWFTRGSVPAPLRASAAALILVTPPERRSTRARDRAVNSRLAEPVRSSGRGAGPHRRGRAGLRDLREEGDLEVSESRTALRTQDVAREKRARISGIRR